MGSYVKQYRRRPDSVGVRIEAFILAKGGPVWSSEVYAHIGQLAAAEVKYLNKTGRIIQLARSLYAPPDFNATPDEIALMVAAKPRRNPNACGDDFVPTKALRRRWSRLEPFAHLIGVQGDEKVGRLAGVSKQAVHDYRKRYGIASSRPYTVADKVTPEVHRFGFDVDAQIAKDAGVSECTVNRYRKKNGVESPSGRVRSTNRVAWVFIEASGVLGVVSDAEIAREAGVSKTSVQLRRSQMSIAPATSISRPSDNP